MRTIGLVKGVGGGVGVNELAMMVLIEWIEQNRSRWCCLRRALIFVLCGIVLSCLPSGTTVSVSVARKSFTYLKVCICRIIPAICGVKVLRSLASLVVILKYSRLTWQAASIGVHSLSCKHLRLALAIKVAILCSLSITTSMPDTCSLPACVISLGSEKHCSWSSLANATASWLLEMRLSANRGWQNIRVE